MTAGKLTSMWPAELLPVALEELEDDAEVPALDSLPWQKYLPLMTCLVLESAKNALQFKVPEL